MRWDIWSPCGAKDEPRKPMSHAEAEEAKQTVAFTIGVIALAAKMARADGVVKRVEVDTFKRLFRVPADELANVGRVFDLARRDIHGFEEYARQIANLFEDRHAVLEELLDSLLMIAEADDELHDTEVEYLRAVAVIFGFDEAEFRRIVAGHHLAGTPTGSDPYAVLGVPRHADGAEIKAAHRALVARTPSRPAGGPGHAAGIHRSGDPETRAGQCRLRPHPPRTGRRRRPVLISAHQDGARRFQVDFR